jgi:Na+(H+)/acetate symporter ActP
MSMSDTTRKQAVVRWVVPATAVLIGIVYLVAGLVGGDTEFALFGFALMVAIGIGFVLLARRSETVAGLQDRRDERINAIDRSATLFAGLVLLGSVLVMFVVEVARGQDGSPYSQLGAIAGLAYLGALTFLRFRR